MQHPDTVYSVFAYVSEGGGEGGGEGRRMEGCTINMVT